MTNLLTQFKALCSFLRLTDSDNTLSLTSIVLMVATVKFAFAPLQMESMVVLLGALASYQGKKLIGRSSIGSETTETLADLGTQLQAMKTEMQVLQNRTNPANRR